MRWLLRPLHAPRLRWFVRSLRARWRRHRDRPAPAHSWDVQWLLDDYAREDADTGEAVGREAGHR